jgi:hypothetical protein
MVQKRFFWFYIITLLVIATASVFPVSQAVAPVIPVTDSSNPLPTTNNSDLLPMADFITAVSDGAELVRGVYVDNVMALRVVQQPAGKAGYVSSIAGVATQFKMAEKYGTIGLLAHNFAAGSNFPQIEMNQIVHVVYGDGKTSDFKVKTIMEFQALSPDSVTSSFLNLATNEKLSAARLFETIYKGTPHLVLQTCIAKGNESSWGRMFIIAEPVDGSAS